VHDSLWVARLIISPATAVKLSSLHGLSPEDVRDAVQCVRGLSYGWDNDPERGLRALVEVRIGRQLVVLVLYPVNDPLGDTYALGSAYPR
jgi:hypothetical protein